MLRPSAAAAIAALALLSGCVGKLATTPNRAVTSLGMARPGTSYALAKVQYDVKLSRALAECPGEFADNDPTKPTALKFKIAVTATPSYVAGESYDIDYSKLPGWLRTASFELKLYPNGTLKSLGASAEDRSAETISGVIKTALSAATVLAAAPFADNGRPPKGGADLMIGCTKAARALVHEADDLDKRLKEAKTTFEALQTRAEYFKAAGTARVLNAAAKARFLQLLDDMWDAERKLNGLKARQEQVAGKLGVSESFTWSGGITSAPAEDAHPLSAANTAKLALLVERVSLEPPSEPVEADSERRRLLPECYGSDSDASTCLRKQLNLRAGVHLYRDLEPCTDGGNPECLTMLPDSDKTLVAARDGKADSGVFIREAMEGQLLFCREISLSGASAAAAPAPAGGQTPAPVIAYGSVIANGGAAGVPAGGEGAPPAGQAPGADGTAGGSLNGQDGASAGQPGPAAAPAPAQCDLTHDEAKLASTNFPQYGQLRFLPLRVGTFQAREMALSMTETGRLDSFTYKSTKAPAERLATLSADVASQLATFREARETERRDDVKYERENALAEIQAQIDTMTKQAALKKLHSPEPDPLQPVKDETAALDAEIALLKAKAERIKAAAALGLTS
ncbi:hypothetical protein NRB_17550 [Novosphingobium sp. 11B]